MRILNLSVTKKKFTWLYQVLQEWWGINETIKNHAQRIANNTGVKTVVPDLYKGKLGLTAEVDKELHRQEIRCCVDVKVFNTNMKSFFFF